MSYKKIGHYQFRCDAHEFRNGIHIYCDAESSIVGGETLHHAAGQCEETDGWLILMGNDAPLETYCPEHLSLYGKSRPEPKRVTYPCKHGAQVFCLTCTLKL